MINKPYFYTKQQIHIPHNIVYSGVVRKPSKQFLIKIMLQNTFLFYYNQIVSVGIFGHLFFIKSFEIEDIEDSS